MAVTLPLINVYLYSVSVSCICILVLFADVAGYADPIQKLNEVTAHLDVMARYF